MNTPTPSPTKHIHHGRNIKRIREILGIKQEALAAELGEDWHQRKISSLEEKMEIEDALLEQVAKALKVPLDAIKNFSEEATFNIVSNTFSEFHDHAQASLLNYQCNFNPLDKYVETVEQNKKLYEALLKEKDEKIEMLQKLMDKK